ncbi:MAG: hypothetical protein GFH27_549287n156 [Chloroflexi bacterium AL-W]|nr:hypothetical protein [Chloroflexi bacterium AL-N1]NOK66430.1 hypothetical protein [Chloroflexi bacterium AL-N10]NOK71818.1 hypothetical protein [Chloroflexi bacterium AL-N5]NOK81075.1 hypothetical protein [Chloroflexi bacterium AL-W]NOK89348.1 hypothetical protein [Chloroflexi bacterium AL-N15]
MTGKLQKKVAIVPGEHVRRRRRSPWITFGILVAVVATVGIGTAAFQFGLPWWMQAGDRKIDRAIWYI